MKKMKIRKYSIVWWAKEIFTNLLVVALMLVLSIQ